MKKTNWIYIATKATLLECRKCGGGKNLTKVFEFEEFLKAIRAFKNIHGKCEQGNGEQ